jgi:hypothetical protein
VLNESGNSWPTRYGTSLAVVGGEVRTVSRTFIGIGVVVAGIVASVAVGGYVMRESAPLPPVTVPAPEPVSPVEPASTPVVPASPPARPKAPVATRPTPAPVPMTTPTIATTVSDAQPAPPVVPTPVLTPVVDPPRVEAAATVPPRYIPDPVPAPPSAPAPEPEPQFDELTVERHSVIGIRLDFAVSTRTARVEDRISATVSRNVLVNERVAIPEGARLEGTVTAVDRGGKFRDRPRIGLQFDTMILTDGTRMSIRTDAVVREGDSPSADAAARVGAGSAVGAILGGLLGGKKGAIIGGAAGAAGGTATVMNGDGNEATLKAGAPLTVRLTTDLTVIVRKQ